MKYIIILFTFLLFGCCNQRERELNDLILSQSIDLLQTKEILTAYTDVDNIARPLNLRIGDVIVKLSWSSCARHAINCIVLDDLSLMFIEPQSGQEVTLSDDEIKSIYFCKFKKLSRNFI